MDWTALWSLRLLGTLAASLALAGCARSSAPPRTSPARAGGPLLAFGVEDVRYCANIWSWRDEDVATPLVDGVLDACGVALDASSLRVMGEVVRTYGDDGQCDEDARGQAVQQPYWLELNEPGELGNPDATVTVGRGHAERWSLRQQRVRRAMVDPTSGAAAILQTGDDQRPVLLWVSADGRVTDSLRSTPDRPLILVSLYDVRAGEVLLTVAPADTEQEDEAELVLWRPTESPPRRLEHIPTPSPPSAARLVGERILAFDGSLWVLSRGARQQPVAQWDPPPLESMGFVRLIAREGRFVADDGREWTADHTEKARYVRGDQSVSISTSPADELANFSDDLAWATAALVRFVPWQRRWARFHRDHTGQRVVHAFTTGDDCAPSHARVMLRERGATIEIWREELDHETQLRLDEVGYGPENIRTAAIPTFPSDAREVPLDFGPEHRHCVSYAVRPDVD